jgi:type I restriction enzyme S subunit
MAGEWPSIALGKVASVRSGFAFKSADWTDAGVPVVKIGNVKDGRLAMDGCSFVSQATAEEAAEFYLREDDILIAMTGYIGEVARVKAEDLPCLLNQRVGRFSVLDSSVLDDSFLFHFLRHPETRKHIEGLGYGSAQPNVSPSLIHKVETPLPPLNEQQAIACILGSLDDKIELNRRRSRTLEAMARAIFKSWFADFDPVRAKAEGRGQKAEGIPGLKPEIANLFPDRLEDSPLGPIPAGWQVKTVSDCCESITSGGTPSRKRRDLWEGGSIAWFKTGELLDGPLFDSDEHITETGLANSSCKLWNVGTILFALYASPTVGRMGVITRPATSNQAAAGLVPRSEYGLHFLFHALLVARPHLQHIAVGAAQQNINQGVLKSHRLVLPSPPVARAFSRLVEPMFAEQVRCLAESRTLAALRDALLPKLISGESEFPAAGAMAEGVES